MFSVEISRSRQALLYSFTLHSKLPSAPSFRDCEWVKEQPSCWQLRAFTRPKQNTAIKTLSCVVNEPNFSKTAPSLCSFSPCTIHRLVHDTSFSLVTVYNEHNKSDILPIVELDGRGLCPQQRWEKRYWEISKLTNTKIHRHGIAWRIHAIASIWNRAGKRARVLPTAFWALHPLCAFAGILCRDSPAEKLALSRDRTSSAAAQRNSKVSSSLRWWISAACGICIIYFTPALLGTLLAARGRYLTNLCSDVPIRRSSDSLWIIYSNATCLIRKSGWSGLMLFPSKISRHQQLLTAHFYYSASIFYRRMQAEIIIVSCILCMVLLGEKSIFF